MAGLLSGLFAREATPQQRIQRSRAQVRKLLKKGDARGALAAAKEGTQTAVEYHGENSEEHAIGLTDEAFLDCVLGRYEEASELYARATAIYVGKTPGQVPYFMGTLGSLALKSAQSDPAAATAILNVALHALCANNLATDPLYGMLEEAKSEL